MGGEKKEKIDGKGEKGGKREEKRWEIKEMRRNDWDGENEGGREGMKSKIGYSMNVQPAASFPDKCFRNDGKVCGDYTSGLELGLDTRSRAKTRTRPARVPDKVSVKILGLVLDSSFLGVGRS
jgi:hypothetical protein